MTPSPKQLNDLYTYCLEFAQKMLEDSSDFYPFGATLSQQGQLTAAGAHNGLERPQPLELYELLAGAFTSGAQSGEFAAVALAANVNIPEQYGVPFNDGIRVHLECDGNARFIYVPYLLEKSGFLKRSTAVVLGEAFAVKVAPTFFAAAPAQ